MAGFVLNRQLFLNADKTKVVEADDPDAAYVLGGEGSTISDEDAKKYGLKESHRMKQATAAASDDEAVAQIESKEEAAADDLESLTVAELKERAKEAGVTGYSAMSKAELIEAVGEAEAEE